MSEIDYKQWITDAETYSAQMHVQMQTAEAHYWADDSLITMTLPGDNINGPRKVILPLARDIVHILFDHLNVKDIKLEGIPRPPQQGDTPTSEEVKRANKRESFGYAAIAEDERLAFRQHLPLPPIMAAYFHLIQRGMGVLKTYHDPRGLPRSKKKGPLDPNIFPWPTVAVDPLTVYLSPGNRYVMESYTAPWGEVEQVIETRGWRMPEDQKMANQEVTYREIWTSTECHYLINDALVGVPVQHGYGFIPYVWGYSGYGAASPTRYSNNGPHNMAVGIINALQEIMTALYYNDTMLEFMLHTTAFAAEVVGVNTQRSETTPRVYVVSPGDIDPHFIATPDKLSETAVRGQQLEAQIRQMTAPSILGGNFAPKQSTATETLGALAEARLRLSGPITALEYMVSTMIEHKLRLFEQWSKKSKVPYSAQRRQKGDVETQFSARNVAIALEAGDIDGYYLVDAIIKPVTAQERALLIQEGKELLAAGRISGATADNEYFGIENTQAEQQQILREKIDQMLAPEIARMVAEQLRVQVQADLMEGQPGEAGKVEAGLADRLAETPSGQNAPPQMNGGTPAGGAAQILNQAPMGMPQ